MRINKRIINLIENFIFVLVKMHLKDIVEKNFRLAPRAPNTKSTLHKCQYCPQQYAYHVSRMAKHLTDCRGCPDSQKVLVRKALEKPNKTKGQKRKLDESFDGDDTLSISSTASNASVSSSGSTLSSTTSTTKRFTQVDGFLDRRMSEQDQKNAQLLLATAICASGAPLGLPDNIYWQKFLEFLRPSFKIPTRHDISNPLLQAIYGSIKMEVETLISNAETVGIQCDGWSNIRREGVINFVITTPKPVFFKTVLLGNKSEDAQYIAEQIRLVIADIGVDKLFAVCTDNAEANLCAARILMKEFEASKLGFFGCIAHVLNLLMKDIAKIESVKSIISSAVSVVNEVKSRRALSSNLAKRQKQTQGVKAKTLKNPGQTRFGSTVICLNSLIVNKHNLQALAIKPKLVDKWTKPTRSLVLNEEFWIQIIKLHALLKPMADWIAKLEGDSSSLSQACQAFHDIEQHLKTETLNCLSLFSRADQDRVMQNVQERKEMALRPIHFAANILDPVEKGKSLSDEEHVMGMELIYELAPKFNLDISKVMSEFTQYKLNEDFFGKEFVKNSVSTVSCIHWWKAICSSTLLSKIAGEILNISPTSAATERTFSTFGWIHSKIRNRLTTRRAGMITYIAHNIRLFEMEEVDKILKRAMSVTFRKRVAAEIAEETREEEEDHEEEEEEEEIAADDDDSEDDEEEDDSDDPDYCGDSD